MKKRCCPFLRIRRAAELAGEPPTLRARLPAVDPCSLPQISASGAHKPGGVPVLTPEPPLYRIIPFARNVSSRVFPTFVLRRVGCAPRTEAAGLMGHAHRPRQTGARGQSEAVVLNRNASRRELQTCTHPHPGRTRHPGPQRVCDARVELDRAAGRTRRLFVVVSCCFATPGAGSDSAWRGAAGRPLPPCVVRPPPPCVLHDA